MTVFSSQENLLNRARSLVSAADSTSVWLSDMTSCSQATVTDGNPLHEKPSWGRSEASSCHMETKCPAGFPEKREGYLGCGVPPEEQGSQPHTRPPAPGSSTQREVPGTPGCENQRHKQPSATLIAQPAAVISTVTFSVAPNSIPQKARSISGNMPTFRHVHITCH